MKKLIKSSIQNHTKILDNIDQEIISLASEVMINAIDEGKTIFWCGNGGSASQANHLSAELMGGMYKEKNKPLKSICLNTDLAFITAWSNDVTFENIFSRQLEALSMPGDIFIGLSTSGNSANIIDGAVFAQSNKLKVISLTGNDGGKLKIFSDININVPSYSTQRIQEIHILIGHILCDVIEQSL